MTVELVLDYSLSSYARKKTKHLCKQKFMSFFEITDF